MIHGIFHNPTKVYFGREMLPKLEECLPEKSNGILVVHAGKSYMNCGAGPFVHNILLKKNLKYIELGNVQSNPNAKLVYEGIEICRKEKLDFILAVGGGSVIDTAKAIGIGVGYTGDFFDLFLHRIQPEHSLPVGVILTIPGSGSETGNAAVITHERLKRKLDCNGDIMFPVFAFLNPDFSLSVPENLTCCGIVDAISHLLERFFSNTDYVKASDHLLAGLTDVLMFYAHEVKKNPHSYDIRAEIMWACKLAHDNTAGFGRKQDWASHNISHEISLFSSAPHGAILSLVFPAWMRFVAKRNPDKIAQFAHMIMKVDSENESDKDKLIESGIKKFEFFLQTLGMPASLRQLKIPKDALQIIADHCSQLNPSGTIGNYCRLNANDVLEILNSIY